MIAALQVLMSGLKRDLKAGINAGGRAHVVGILTALAFSAPLIVALFALSPLGIGASTAIGCTVQLFAGWIAAGRHERVHDSDNPASVR
ncbi:MAG: hypothetical protein ACLFPA_04990 [Dichotomicrobium sp.]